MSDVFLSHDWGILLDEIEKTFQNHELVKILNQMLKDFSGFTTWLDEEKLSGNIRDEITKGIENSNCVLVFLTQNYHEKVNSMNPQDYCYFELNFAAHILTNKRMIPVIMEEEMRDTKIWRGRLAAELGQHKYIDLVDAFKALEQNGDRSVLELKCQEISREINYVIRECPRILSSLSSSGSSVPPNKASSHPWIVKLFNDPLSYSPGLLSEQFKKLHNELITNPEHVNEELLTINFYEFFLNLIGFADTTPIRFFLELLPSVNRQVLEAIQESLISFFFHFHNELSNKNKDQPYNKGQKRLLIFISEADGIKIFIQLFSKYFLKENSLEIIKQLLLIFRILKFFDTKNLVVLTAMEIYQNIVPSFQVYYKLSFIEVCGIFEVEYLKVLYKLSDLIEIGFSLSVLAKEYPVKTCLEYKFPLKSLKGTFSVAQVMEPKPEFSVRDFLLEHFPLEEIIGVFGLKEVESVCKVSKVLPSARYSFAEFLAVQKFKPSIIH
jgi:hypothetical protein